MQMENNLSLLGKDFLVLLSGADAEGVLWSLLKDIHHKGEWQTLIDRMRMEMRCGKKIGGSGNGGNERRRT